MTIVENPTITVTGGVDTHLEFHVAAAFHANGGVLGVDTFENDPISFFKLSSDDFKRYGAIIGALTIGIIISASVIAGSLVLNSSQKVMEFTLNFFGVHTVSITSLLGIIGYSMATVLGVWLIISIMRSGKM